MMFELIEAVSGRLFGPKSWNRIVVNFEAQIGQSVTVHAGLGCWIVFCQINHVLVCMRLEMAEKFRFTK